MKTMVRVIRKLTLLEIVIAVYVLLKVLAL